MAERLLDIVPGFMDSLGEATLIVTDKAAWLLLRVPSYGYFISMDEDRETVYQIQTLAHWMAEHRIKVLKQNSMGTFAVRDLFPKLRLYNDKSFKGVDVDIWINAVLPSGNPINVDQIRFEAYVDQMQAFTDAEEEMNSGPNVSRVVTTKLSINIPKKVDEDAGN